MTEQSPVLSKVTRQACDYASVKVIDALIRRSGYGNREIDRLCDGTITYGRIRDIRNGLKAPVRLPEFLLICEVCNADPIQTLRDIITEARRMELEQQTATKKPTGERLVVNKQARVAETLNKLRRGDLDFAAHEDEHKYDGDEDDPA